jgi:uncharacterized protein involved in exopolysaccharide biosynthesis
VAAATREKEDFVIAEAMLSFRDIARVLFRHQRIIILFFVLVVTSTAAAMMMAIDIYQSEAQLLVRVGRESVVINPEIIGSTLTGIKPSRENIINSEISILQSQTVIEKVVERHGPEKILGLHQTAIPDPDLSIWHRILVALGLESPEQHPGGDMSDASLSEQAVAKVMKDLKVSNAPENNVINLSFNSYDPAFARDVLKSLIVFYLERHISIHQEKTSPDFIKNRTEILRGEFETKQQKLSEMRDEYMISDLNAQKKALLEQIRALDDRLDETQAQHAASSARIKSFADSLANLSETRVLQKSTGDGNPVADSINGRLVDLRFKAKEMEALYAENHRKRVDIEEQIRMAEKSLAKAKKTRSSVTTGLDSNYQRLSLEQEIERANLEAQSSTLVSLKSMLADKERQLADLVDLEIILSGLEDEVKLAHDNYDKFRVELGRSDVISALDSSKITNISILQDATLHTGPVKPNKPRNMLLAIAIGLVGGIGLAFVLDFLDDSLKSNEDVVRKLGLPVLGTLSEKEYQTCI